MRTRPIANSAIARKYEASVVSSFRSLCVVALFAGAPWSAPAHDAFMEFVWHRVELGVNARHVDVTVELTFFEDWSERERQRMDADQDGRIRKDELEKYAAQLSATVNKAVHLTIAGRPVTLVPLYDPEVNLLGRDTVQRSHHQLTLRFFAALPAGLPPSEAIVVEDRLWPAARCLGELKTASGSRLEAGEVTERAPAGAATSRPLRFTARYR
jgi:hypothetical protein